MQSVQIQYVEEGQEFQFHGVWYKRLPSLGDTCCGSIKEFHWVGAQDMCDGATAAFPGDCHVLVEVEDV